MKVLLVHGVGHSDSKPAYYEPWKQAITTGLQAAGFTGEIVFEELHYDDRFDAHDHSMPVYLAALAELAGAAAWHAVADPVDSLLHPSRGFGEDLRWTAGMVAQLCVENSLRREMRDLLAATLAASQPDIIAAHSLGSLVTYDFLRNDTRGATAAQGATYLTFGSQINNPFAHSRLFPGPIKVPNVRFWFHLFNPQDHVLTAPISIPDPRFHQVPTPSTAGHDPIGTPDHPGYLSHPNTASQVWSAVATPAGSRAFARTLKTVRKLQEKPRRRALLVGINNYPDPANRLEGCVNDTFLISALLQERGFRPEDIRVVLDDRATSQGIRERLHWLLEGAEDGMERVFFYSGHGAQMPGYNPAEKVDHLDECLVPWDFAWSKESAIIDDDLFSLYSNLPFNARFLAMFDCCHAGGIHRDGGPRVRGIAPPDDIRHRLLEWDADERMWRQRKLPQLMPEFGGSSEERAAYMGSNGATFRIGRGMKGRKLEQDVYRVLPADERGPFLPVIIEACQESFLSYEYRDGATSYGAFTYAFAKNLRAHPSSTFIQAVARTAKTLDTLGYRQVPQIIGPRDIVKQPLPGLVGKQAGKDKGRK